MVIKVCFPVRAFPATKIWHGSTVFKANCNYSIHFAFCLWSELKAITVSHKDLAIAIDFSSFGAGTVSILVMIEIILTFCFMHFYLNLLSM